MLTMTFVHYKYLLICLCLFLLQIFFPQIYARKFPDSRNGLVNITAASWLATEVYTMWGLHGLPYIYIVGRIGSYFFFASFFYSAWYGYKIGRKRFDEIKKRENNPHNTL